MTYAPPFNDPVYEVANVSLWKGTKHQNIGRNLKKADVETL